MRQSVLIVFGVLVFTFLFAHPAQASVLELSIGVSQNSVVQQSTPSPFKNISRWLDVGASLVFDRVSVSFGASLFNFETLEIEKDPTYALQLDVSLLSLLSTSIYAGLRVSYKPSARWISVGGMLGIKATFLGFLQTELYLLVSRTPGANCCPEGWGIFFGGGVSISIGLL